MCIRENRGEVRKQGEREVGKEGRRDGSERRKEVEKKERREGREEERTEGGRERREGREGGFSSQGHPPLYNRIFI